MDRIEPLRRAYTPYWAEPAPRTTSRGVAVGVWAHRAARVLLHLGLLAATAVTTTLMGTLLSVDVPVPEDGGVLVGLASLAAVVAGDPSYFASGLVFSFTLLTILGAHELGHYLACRYHRVEASLPYFIPAPPPILIGTFGAFISIRSPFTTRRALFDIGVAGPIAGFCFALPAAVIGIVFASPVSGPVPEGAITFNDPVLFVAIQRLLDIPASIQWNPIYFAAWVGIFATGLNLIPVGQLDGGHATFALFGDRGHRALSVLFFAAVTVLAAVSFLRFGSPVWFLYVVLLALFALRRHPPTLLAEDDIGRGRRVVAGLVVLIFVLSFLPFPITFEG